MLKGFGNSKVIRQLNIWILSFLNQSLISFQFSVTDSQRDMVANYSRSERDKGERQSEKRVNLNLYGNKFYSAKKEKTNSSGKQNRQQGEGNWVIQFNLI